MLKLNRLSFNRLKNPDAALVSGVAGLGLIGLLVSHWAICLLFLALSWWLISKLFDRTFFTSLFSGLVFGFVVSLVAIVAFSALFWLLHIRLNLVHLGIVAHLLTLAAGLVVNGRGLTLPFKHQGIIDTKDISGLLAVAMCVGLYVVGSFKNNHGLGLKIEAVQNTTRATDDQNHFVMFKSMIDTNSGLLLGARSPFVPNSIHAVYPKGAHMAAAVLAEMGRGLWAKGDRTAAGTIDELYVYAFMKTFFFIATIYVFARFTLEIAMTILRSSKANWLTELAAGFLTTLAAGYIAATYLTPLIIDGAFSFIPIFLLAPVFILTYADFIAGRAYYSLAIVLGLIAAATTLTWTIAGAPLYVLLTMAVGRLILQKDKLKKIGLAAAILAISGLLGLVQLYVQFTNDVAILNVNTPGGFFTFNVLLAVILLAFILLGSAKLRLSNKANALYSSTLLLVAMLIAICAGIAFINIRDTAELQYYFIKLFYLPFVILAYLAAGLAVGLLMNSEVTSGQPQPAKPLVFFDRWSLKLSIFGLVLSTVFIAFPPNYGVIDYLVNGHRTLSQSTAAILIKELSTNPADGSVATFVLSNNFPHFENIMTTQTLVSHNPGNRCQGVIFDYLYHHDTAEVFTEENIAQCVAHGEDNIRILTNSDIYDQLPEQFGDRIDIQIIKV